MSSTPTATVELGLDAFGDVTVDAEGRLLSQAQVIRDVIAEAEPHGDLCLTACRQRSASPHLIDSAGVGILATIVPESDSGPHMAKGREDRYFKRSGARRPPRLSCTRCRQ